MNTNLTSRVNMGHQTHESLNLGKTYSVRELLSELKKVKYSRINDEILISEISKKNRKILEAFEIDLKEIHRY